MTRERLTQGADVPEIPLFDELPDGLIDVPTAARKYGRSTGTLRVWARSGLLTVVGRLRASAPGGGYLVVREVDVAAIDKQRPRRSR